jgi:hypothetical protein
MMVHQLEELSSFYLPWYLGPKGEEVRYDNRQARPVRLSDVPLSLNGLKPERRDLIGRLAALFEQSRPPIQLVAAAYALPSDEYLILDGNHRLAALATSNVPFRAVLFVVHGPADPSALPDLIHWRG